MKKRAKITLRLIASVLLLSLTFAQPVYGKDYTARLKECLTTEKLYKAVSVVGLNNSFNYDVRSFKNTYHNKYVVVSGSVKIDSVTEDQKEIVISDNGGNKCTVSITGANAEPGLYVGGEVTVYGKVTVKGIVNYSYEIAADQLKASNTWLTTGQMYFSPKEDFSAVSVNDLTSSGSVKFRIPATWNNGYVKSDLTNNGIKGYQYNLNAIAPQDMDYPEIFHIFWFNNETYLEKMPSNPTTNDYKAIEKEIIKNILQGSASSTLDVSVFEDTNGNKIHYCSTSYRPKDGRDYRLEFTFRPSPKGIVCMLYLYYPSENTVHHVKEAAYVVGSMTVPEGD